MITSSHIRTRDNALRIAIYFLLTLNHLAHLVSCNDVTDLFGGNKPYDTNLDWESNVASAGKNGCTPAKKAAFKPPPVCPAPNEPVSREVAAKLGVRFAPILYQHPLDTSWLTDPAHWLDEAVVYNMERWNPVPGNRVTVPPGAVASNASSEYTSAQAYFATRLAVPRYNETSREVTFTVDNGTEVLRKAVMDPVVGGRLTGRVYYTAFRPFDRVTGETIPHAYVFTYMYYYPWNGCSNQVVGTQVNGRKQGVEYIMCGEGAHEGDLEHVKVYVCEADLLAPDPAAAIRAAQYSQHGWLPELDCTAGECEFEADEAGQRRLVVLAGLGSHANWKAETPLYLYTKVRANFLLNMDGLYLGDRFAKGPVLYPDENNTRFLPFLAEMSPEQQTGELAWATYPGVWGATIEGNSTRTISCLSDNITVEGACTALNPAYYILRTLLDPASWRQGDMNWTAVKKGNDVTGPLWDRVFAYNWELEREAPLYKGSGFDGYCPLEAPIQQTEAGLSDFQHLSLKGFLAVVTGLVLASSVVAFAMLLPALLIRQDREVLRELHEQLHRQEQEEEEQQEATKHGTGRYGAPSETAAAATVPDHAASIPAPGSGSATTAATASFPAATAPVAAVAAAAVVGKQGYLAAPPPSLTSSSRAADGANGGAGAAGAANGPGGPQRGLDVGALVASHKYILRAFHASIMHPYFFVAWVFVGVAFYIAGVVLGALGIHETVTALNLIAPLSTWQILSTAVTAVFVVFGVVQLGIVIASIFVLPMSYKFCACGRKDPDAGLKRLRGTWTAHAVLAGLLVIEMSVTLLLFGFSLILWVARYGMTEICIAMIIKLFTEVIVLDDVCLDLSYIGLSDNICIAELSSVCGVWSGLNVEWLVFGCMLFLIAQSMFLVLATTNYVAMRTGSAITAVMGHTQQAAADRQGQGGATRLSRSTLSTLMGSGRRLGAALRFRSRDRSTASGAAAPLAAAVGGGASGVKSEMVAGAGPSLGGTGRAVVSESDVGKRGGAVSAAALEIPPTANQGGDMA